MKPTTFFLFLIFLTLLFISISYQHSLEDDSIDGERESYQIGCERNIRDLQEKIQQYQQVIEICDILFQESQEPEILEWKLEATDRLFKIEHQLSDAKQKLLQRLSSSSS